MPFRNVLLDTTDDTLEAKDGAITKSILHNGGDGGRILVNSKYDKVDLDNGKISTWFVKYSDNS